MNKRTVFFLAILAVLTAIFGWGRYKVLPEYANSLNQKNRVEQENISLNAVSENSTSQKVEQIFQKLSEKEKVSQLIAYPFTLSTSTSSAQLRYIASSSGWIKENNPGFVTIFGQNISSVSAKKFTEEVNQITGAYEVQPLIAVDHEGGKVQRLNGKGFTKLVAWQDICKLEATESAKTLSQSAAELADVGVTLVFGPTVDIGNNPALGNRICSENISVTILNAENWINQFSAQEVDSVIKHFPGIGDGKNDLHLSSDTNEIDPNKLKVFSYLLEKYPSLHTMSTHVTSNFSDSEKPCSLDKECLAMLSLRTNQILFSDALEMKSLQPQPERVGSTSSSVKIENIPLEILSIRALEAGNTVIVFGSTLSSVDADQIILALEKKYQTSEEFKNIIDQKVKKVLEYKLEKMQ